MSAPLKNKNARKPAKERISGMVWARCSPADRKRWEAAAKKAGFKKLPHWINAILNQATPAEK